MTIGGGGGLYGEPSPTLIRIYSSPFINFRHLFAANIDDRIIVRNEPETVVLLAFHILFPQCKTTVSESSHIDDDTNEVLQTYCTRSSLWCVYQTLWNQSDFALMFTEDITDSTRVGHSI